MVTKLNLLTKCFTILCYTYTILYYFTILYYAKSLIELNHAHFIGAGEQSDSEGRRR